MAFILMPPRFDTGRFEHKVDSWAHVGLAVLAGYVLASWANHVPLLQHRAAQVPTLAHEVVVAKSQVRREHAKAVAAEKDRDAIVRAVGADMRPTTYDDPPLPSPKPN